jgi:manganese/zinc/iron transport system substrate-binding protein
MRGVWILLLAASLLACEGKKSTVDEPSEYTVVCTTTMIYDAARSIAPNGVKVLPLMKAGVDPHYFKPTLDDLKLLRSADMILYNGLELEGKMADILQKLENEKVVKAIAEGFPDSVYIRNGIAVDPHVWFDPQVWKMSVQNVGLALNNSLKEQQVEIQEATEAYLNAIDSLDGWTKEQISSLPANRRVLFTSHDAFGYFGRAYDFDVRGLQGITTTAEFGLRDVSEMVSSIVDMQIPAVFAEQSIPPKYIEAVVEGCRQKGFEIKVSGTLFSDSLGEEGTEEDTYVGTVRYNVSTIVNALR